MTQAALGHHPAARAPECDPAPLVVIGRARCEGDVARRGRRGERALEALESVFEAVIDGPPAVDGPDAAAVLARARAAAKPLVPDAVDMALEVYAGQALTGLAVEAGVDPRLLEAVLDEAERLAGISRPRVSLRALGDPSFLTLPLDAAVPALLGLLAALAPLDDVSLQLLGEPVVRRPARAVTVRCWQRPYAVLGWRPEPEPGAEAECELLAERVAGVLGIAFERASLIEGNVARLDSLLRDSERRLVRLGFDLHDGPLQDLTVLAGELEAVRAKLRDALAGDPGRDELVARLDDVDAVVAYLDAELRELAISLDAPAAARRPLAEAIHGVVRLFAARSGIEPQVRLAGDLDALTESQRIALLRIVQEALANVRAHSGARSVRIAVAVRRTHIEARIVDDGRGFDVERALRLAVRGGHMGLLGMQERIRLLGGTCEIRSRPGAGTVISVTLARWAPGRPGLAGMTDLPVGVGSGEDGGGLGDVVAGV